MSTEAWVITLTAVAADGNVTQLYPARCSAGVAKAGSTVGQLIRRPMQGALHSLQVNPDGTNACKLELWDLSGEDVGADVSSATTVTNAQLTTLINAGKAKKIYEENFPATVGSGILNAPGLYRAFVRGLAARLSNAGVAGTATLNLVVTGGCCKQESRGGY